MQKTTNNLFSKQLKRPRKSIFLTAYILMSVVLLNAQGGDPIYIKSNDAFESQHFGHEISISGDFMAVSAINMDLYSDSGLASNAVYVYKKTSEGDWSQIQKIDSPSNSFNSGGFGYSISMSEDHLAIGCIYENQVSYDGKTGLVYTYKKDEEGYWTLQQELSPILDQEGDAFGISVDIEGDDLVIGSSSGIYKYTFEDGSFQWNTMINTSFADYFLGHTIKISGDYLATLRFNSFYKDFDVLIYSIVEDGLYALESTIEGINGDFLKGLSSNAVPSISLHGNQLVITSFAVNNNSSVDGSIYVYERDDNANWIFKQQIVPETEDGELDWIGGSVVLTDKYLVTSGGFINWNQEQEGALWVFKQNTDNVWTQDISFYSGPTCEQWCSGWALDIDDDALAMGSIFDFTDGDFAGQAYMFDLNYYTNVSSPEASFAKLNQNRPNPFREETVISFDLAQPSAAVLKIIDLNGQVIQIIKGDYSKGNNQISVKCDAAPGIYYFTLESAGFTSTKKMIIID